MQADTLRMARVNCRALIDPRTGRLCTQPVREEGLRCYWHKGWPEGRSRSSRPPAQRKKRAATAPSYSLPPRPPRQTVSRAERQERRREERVQKAAEYCADVLTSGWAETVAERATAYVSDPTWERLFRGRYRARCKTLAQIAAAILDAKQEMHNLLGWLASGLASLLGAGGAAQAFTDELVSNLPLPVDAKFIAAARGVQITGIVLCVWNGDALTNCECFLQLALAETKTQVKKLLVAASGDWIKLAAFTPRVPRSAGVT